MSFAARLNADKAAKTATRTDAPTTPYAGSPTIGGTPYGLKALAEECAKVAAAVPGTRNDTLNRSAIKIGGLVATGELDDRTARDALAMADGGLGYHATDATIESAFTAAAPRVKADLPDLDTEIAAWERSLASGRPAADTGASATTTPRDGIAANGAATADGAAGGDSASTDVVYDLAVKAEAASQRLRRDARRLLDQEDATRDFRVPTYLPTLTHELALPDDPITYAVDQLIPTGANVVLTAGFKTGKTTMINNLARSLVDGEPFLGTYDVATLDGRVALFNYEVDGRQYRRWLRDMNIGNTDNVAVLNLRGYRLPLTVPFVEDWVVNWLRRAEAVVWIVDPFARALTGSADENDNTEVGVWLDTLDVIKERSGVSELILPNHTGRGEMEHGAERGRGATRLDDWADVRWLLTKDGDGVRYFRATGRDVDTDEAALTFHEPTRALALEGGSRADRKSKADADRVLAHIAANPGVGSRALREAKIGVATKSIGPILTGLIGDKLVDIAAGPRGAVMHYIHGYEGVKGVPRDDD